MPKAVIFDCDGVLVDSEVLSLEIELACLAEIGLNYDRHAYVERFLGTGGNEYYGGLDADHRQQFGAPLPDTFKTRLHERYGTEMEARLQAIPGVHDVARGVTGPKAVASSSNIESLEKKLRKTALFDHFAPHIYSAQMVARAKPAPDLFLFAAQKIGVAPEDCVVVEDSKNGVLGARAAGMRVIGFVGGGHCAPHQADKLRAAGAVTVVDHMNQVLRAIAGIV